MVITDCLDINELKIQYNPNNTISAYLKDTLSPYPLKKPCCEKIGGFFDIETQKCFKNSSLIACDYSQPINLVLNPVGNSFAIFSDVIDETCTLEIQFDYLFKFDCNELSQFISGQLNSSCTRLDSIFENIIATMSIEKITPSQFGSTSTSVYEETFFTPIGVGKLLDYLQTNSGNTGFYICQPSEYDGKCNDLDLSDNVFLPRSNCFKFAEKILLEHPTIPNNSFGSNWLSFSTEITNPSVLSAITDERIKLVIKLSGFCIDMCVLVDNIRLNKKCTKSLKDEIFVTKSLGFEFDRIIDNKKSWVTVTERTHREYSILKTNNTQPIRYTDYYLENERQVLNTKEIDLDIDIASAVETDIWCYISDNQCILTGNTIGVTTCIKDAYNITCAPKTYCCSEYCGDANIDVQKLFTESLSGVTTIEDFKYYTTSQLIDAKNRQTITSYSTLRLLYDRYMNSTSFCTTQSAKFDYYKMEDFANLVGNYWVELIEQVIPATTIWGSTRIYTNTMFDGQKYKYKAYTTHFGTPIFNKVLSPATGATCNVSATTTVITGDTNTLPQFNQQTYSVVYIKQMNSSSEFIGKVTIGVGSGRSYDKSSEIVTCDLDVIIENNILSNGTLTAIPTGYNGIPIYQWETPTSTANTQSVLVTTNGLYKVRVTDDICYAETTINIT